MVARLKLVSVVSLVFLFLQIPIVFSPAQEDSVDVFRGGSDAPTESSEVGVPTEFRRIVGTNVGIKASVDKPKISQDELLNFKIEIAGDLEADPQIDLPGLKKDFDIVSTAQTQSLQFKGKETLRQVAVIYGLAAKTAGRFTIGGATVKIGKESFKTESIDIEVTPSLNPKPALPQNPPDTEPEELNPEEQVIL